MSGAERLPRQLWVTPGLAHGFWGEQNSMPGFKIGTGTGPRKGPETGDRLTFVYSVPSGKYQLYRTSIGGNTSVPSDASKSITFYATPGDIVYIGTLVYETVPNSGGHAIRVADGFADVADWIDDHLGRIGGVGKDLARYEKTWVAGN